MPLTSLIFLFLASCYLNSFGFPSDELVIRSTLLDIFLLNSFLCLFWFDFISVWLKEWIWYWSLTNWVSDDVIFMEFSYSYYALLWNCGIANSPNFTGKDRRIRALPKYKYRLTIAGIKLKRITSSNCFIKWLSVGILCIKKGKFPFKTTNKRWVCSLWYWFPYIG